MLWYYRFGHNFVNIKKNKIGVFLIGKEFPIAERSVKPKAFVWSLCSLYFGNLLYRDL